MKLSFASCVAVRTRLLQDSPLTRRTRLQCRYASRTHAASVRMVHQQPTKLDENSSSESVIVLDEHDGERVDKVLASQFKQSRAYFHELLTDGFVQINGATVRAKSHRVKRNDKVVVVLRTPQREMPLQPEDIPLDMLYEDAHMAIINKEAGLVVHPAPGHWSGTLAHALAHRYGSLDTTSTIQSGGSSDPKRAGIVHRLDKDTTGALAIARTREAHDAMAISFAARNVLKEYICITAGSPAGQGARGGIVEVPIGRDPHHRLRMAVIPEEEGGKAASSTYQVLAHDSRALLHIVRFRIHTGRTHQVRVHARHLRAPVLGDSLYGAPVINTRFRTAAARPLLHAHVLELPHPATSAPVRVVAPLPEDMRRLIERQFGCDAEEIVNSGRED